MTSLLFKIAVFFTLLAAGGFIVYLLKTQKAIFRLSFLFLLAGFIIHTSSIGIEYYELGTAPVTTLKSALSFFSWTIIAAYFILFLKFRLFILGSFVTPFAAFFMLFSSIIPPQEVHLSSIYHSIWLPIHFCRLFHALLLHHSAPRGPSVVYLS
jgi:ABC-type uncharacterized transport system permease subunit